MKTHASSTGAVWKICAASEDYSEKAYCLYYGENFREYIPKSKCKYIMNYFGEPEYGEGKAARWYTIPSWLMARLKGKQYYKITK